MLNIGTKQYKLKRVIRRLDLKAASPAKGLQKTKKGGGEWQQRDMRMLKALRTKPEMRESYLLMLVIRYYYETTQHAAES